MAGPLDGVSSNGEKLSIYTGQSMGYCRANLVVVVVRIIVVVVGVRSIMSEFVCPLLGQQQEKWSHN